MTTNTDASTYGLVLADILEDCGWRQVGSDVDGVRNYRAPLPSWLPDWTVIVQDHPNYGTQMNVLETAYQRGLQASAVFDRLRAAAVVT